jgi:hypothetical protein
MIEMHRSCSDHVRHTGLRGNEVRLAIEHRTAQLLEKSRIEAFENEDHGDDRRECRRGQDAADDVESKLPADEANHFGAPLNGVTRSLNLVDRSIHLLTAYIATSQTMSPVNQSNGVA